MKAAAFLASALLAIAGAIVPARAADDPLAQLRECSLMERAERLECLDRLSHAAVRSAPAAVESDRWVVSLTSSPLDYSPIATATTVSREIAGSDMMQLWIRCRGGRTEVAVTGPAISEPADNYVASYRINAGQPLDVAVSKAAFGPGVAFKGDVVASIQSLPSEGELTVHLAPRVGASHHGIFSLTGLDAVRTKIAPVCKWPHVIATPNN
jgi:hypothetical protein